MKLEIHVRSVHVHIPRKGHLGSSMAAADEQIVTVRLRADGVEHASRKG